MTNAPDISKEAVERLAKAADLFASAMKAFQHHTKKHNEDVRDTLRAQAARIAELEAALKTAREDALRDFVDECENRADMMDGVEMECCRGTAVNCASDAENLISKEPPHDK